MRQIQNIGRVLLSLLVLGLVSCGQNEADELCNSNNGNGMEVPEGYMLVSFPIEGEVSTRAAELNPSTGAQTRIQHLQYLLYKKPDGGSDTDCSAWVLEKKGTIEENGSGIYFPKSFSLPLPIDNQYKIVFLANVSESLFTGQTESLLENVEVGTNSYSEAIVNAPDVAFGENNMYYLANATFNTTKEVEGDSKKDVIGVCLQRMVSRSLLTTYGIRGEYDETQTTYEGRYYSSLLNDDAIIGKFVFGNDVNSALGESFHQLIMEDIVFPFAYMLDSQKNLDGAMKTWFDEEKTSYEAIYEARGIEKTVIEGNLQNYASGRTNFTNQTLAKNVQAFIQELKDNTSQLNYIGEMLQVIKVKDIKNTVEDVSASKGTFTIAKQSTAKQLENDQKAGGVFGAWNYWMNTKPTMNAQLQGTVMTAVDLDLNMKKTSDDLSINNMTLTNATEREDSSLPIILLANKTGEYKFNLSSLKSSFVKPLPENGITENKELKPNISTTYRVTPTDVTWDGATITGKPIKIVVAYGSLFNKMKELSTGKSWENVLSEDEIKYALYAVYNLLRADAVDFTLTDGRLTKDSKTTVGFYFNIPDFSNEHLTGTLSWEVDEVN